MGERDAPAPPELAAARVADRSWRAGGVLLLAIALLAGWSVLPRPRLDADSTDALLLARSLASDGDRLWSGDDAARAAHLALTGEVAAASEGEDEVLAPSSGHETGEPFRTPVVYGLLLAPWAAMGGARAALLAQWALLGVAALLAARTLGRRLRGAAAWLPLVLLLGSSLFACAFHLWSDVALAALALLAFTLALGGGARAAALPVDALPDIYPGGEELAGEAAPAARVALRWLVVGALLGAVASAGWWLLPLLAAAAAAVPRRRRGAGLAALLAGAALALLLVAVAGAATAHAAPAPRALLRALGWSAPAWSGLGPHLLGWDLAYLVAGRHVGLLLYAAPLVLLAVLTPVPPRRRGDPVLDEALLEQRRARRALWSAAVLAVLLLVVLRPFDLAGSPFTVGLRSLLPVYAALWLVPARAPGRGAVTLAVLWAAAWLWPLWRSPGAAVGPAGELRYAAPYLAPWSPLETTQPRLRFGAPLSFGKTGRLVLLGGEALGGGHVAAVPAGTWVELLAGVPGDIPGFWVDAGEQAGNDLPVRGGEVTDTMFRPDGGIAFMVRPKHAVALHRMPGSPRAWSFYHVSFRLPGKAGARFTIRVRPG